MWCARALNATPRVWPQAKLANDWEAQPTSRRRRVPRFELHQCVASSWTHPASSAARQNSETTERRSRPVELGRTDSSGARTVPGD